MQFVLFLVLSMAGHPNQEKYYPMENLDKCTEAVHSVLSEEAPVVLEQLPTAQFQASCIVLKAPPPGEPT